MRYMVFAWKTSSPLGGMNDLKVSFTSKCDAVTYACNALEEPDCTVMIYDTEQQKVTFHSHSYSERIVRTKNLLEEDVENDNS